MSKQSKKSYWGIFAFTLPAMFLIFIISIVGYVSTQDMQLVEENYYQDGLVYQNRIDQLNRTALLENSLVVKRNISEQSLLLTFPMANSPVSVAGEIRFIRSSNANLDKTITINLNETGQQLVSTENMIDGLWRLEINWSVDSLAYFHQQSIAQDCDSNQF